MKKINLFLFLILTFVSCQEMPFMQEVTITETAEGLNLLEWYNVLKEPNDGSLLLQASRGLGSQDSPNKAYIEQGLIKDKNGKAMDVGTIEFGTIKMNPDEGNIYRSGFKTEYTANYGETVIVKIKEDIASFYLPKEIRLEQTDLGIGGNTEIYPNFIFKWNKDEKNEAGVVIRISYSPSENHHITDAANSYKKVADNYILTDDTGEYPFKNADFAGIPNGAYVRINVLRGGAAIMNTEDNKRIHLWGTTQNSVIRVKVNLEK